MESLLNQDKFIIHPKVQELYKEMVQLRRSFHKEPEILYDLPKTREKILQYLKGTSVEIQEAVGRSGIVGLINNPGPCILLRADMDALNITEMNASDYISGDHGKMHACGHDGHMAMLLIAAKVLSNMKLNGSVKFVFQPAEEGGHGAREMIQDPHNPVLMQPEVNKVFGMHITNSTALGNFIAAPQYASCSSDYFFIEIIGTGGHASTPHLSIDPITAGTHLTMCLQTIISRNMNPVNQAVLSVTMFHAGEVFNAIPGTCQINGTIRTFESEVIQMIQRRIQELCESVEKGFNCKVNLNFQHYYDPIVNDKDCVESAVRAFGKVVAGGAWEMVAPMIGEDFCYFTQQKPGCFIMLGCGTEENTESLHSAKFDFDERAMLVGASYWVQLITDLLT